jgi:hypothetical protein
MSAVPPSDPPPQNPYGPFQPFGSYAPSSGYGQPYPYGQPPVAPGYPPPGYSQLAPTPSAPIPSPTRKKPRTKLIIGIVAVVVVVLGACGWGVVATVQALHLPTSSAVPRETPNEVYSNSFTSGSGSAAGWIDDSHCFLKNDGYHINDYACYAPLGNYSDVDIKIQLKQISGPTDSPMGVMFRLQEEGSSYGVYLFAITSAGYWEFANCNFESDCTRLVNFRRESASNTGIGASNTLEVYAKGAHMDFFINGKAVGSLNDATYSTGEIGLLAGDGMECVFTNLFIGELD